MPTLSARLLGGFSLAVDGEPLSTVSTARLQSLLAYLLLHCDSPVSRHQLAFLFWADSSEAQAHTNLRKLLHALRNSLPCVDTLLLTDTHTLRWNPAALPDLDVGRFNEHASRAESITDLQQAVELYGGDLLPACYDEWVLPERERLRQTYLGTLERLVRLLEEQHDYRTAVVYARRQLQYDPLSEETYRELMRLSALSGNRAQVIWFYKTCTTVLQREFGVEPSDETQEAYGRYLELAAQPPAALAQAVASPVAAPPNNLPLPLTSLIGRVREREEVARLVTANRLLTLTGPPGVGKTRLAIQVAADSLENFAGGAWLIELAPLRDPEMVVPTIARLFGLSETSGAPIIETLKRYLHEKELLLVLDNFEHITDAAADIGELLACCSQLRVLATSRVPLRLSGEHEYPVRPLSVPAGEHAGIRRDREEMARYESVRLFVERAQAVLPVFVLNSSNAGAVAQICARLDGLPLAIELAAARVRLFPPEALLARLEHGLRLLTGGPRDLPERHRTLRSAIEWSYDLLSGGEQQLFRRMAVFNGGRTLEALEAVCNFDGKLHIDVLEGVEALVEQSLLEQREGRNPEPRLWMLETIHEFARERLEESGEAEAVTRAHARYFLALCEEAKPHVEGHGQQEWLDRLEDELSNLESALRWAAGRDGDESEQAEDVEAGLRAAAAITQFWVLKYYCTEGRAHLRELLEKAAQSPSSGSLRKSQVNALAEAARLAFYQGDITAAQPLAEGALRLAKEIGDKTAIAAALYQIGMLDESLWEFGAARRLFEESLAIKKELHDRFGIAACLVHLGLIAMGEANAAGQIDYRKARTLLEESLAIWRELGNNAMVAWQTANLGQVAFEQGDCVRARALFEESLPTCEELGDKDSICWLWTVLGNLCVWERDYAGAAAFFAKSLAMGREFGIIQRTTQTLVGMGNLACEEGDYPAASAHFEEAAELQREAGDIFASRYFSGIAANLRGDCVTALALLEEALTLYAERDFGRGVAEVVAQLGETFVGMGQPRRGAVLLGAANGLMCHLGVLVCRLCSMSFERAGERAIASARAQLGDEEFDRAWAEGQAMSMEEIVGYSLDATPAYA